MISKSKKKFILPKHVAIIMDGNNRWTKKHKLKGFKGHEKGIDAIQNAVDASKLYNIKFLTLFSFSSENWTRPKNEVNFLMNLLRKYLKNKIEDLMKDNISIKMIGDKKKLPKDIVKKFITKKIKINEESISSHLFTKNFPDPDLLIRTSGEKRLSNFLLWQLAYTELVFLDVLWPDFKKRHFVESLNQYSKRVRRYGSR